MKRRCSPVHSLLAAAAAVLLLSTGGADAFKIPEFLNFGGGQKTMPPHANIEHMMKTTPHGNKNNIAEYAGPVLVIKEIGSDDEKSYNAFVTTGDIQEVKPGKTAAEDDGQTKSPDDTADEQDPDYYGVLITHDTTAQLKLPGSLRVNVSLSVLLQAATSRMPWLLVLHRNSTIHMSVHRAPRDRQRRRTAADRPSEDGDDDRFVVRYVPVPESYQPDHGTEEVFTICFNFGPNAERDGRDGVGGDRAKAVSSSSSAQPAAEKYAAVGRDHTKPLVSSN